MRGLWALTALSVMVSGIALADEPKVAVNAEVVSVSKQGNAVDPPSLQSMKDYFQQNPKSRAFTSFKRVSVEKIVLQRGKSQLVKAPNGAVSVRLDELKNDTAMLNVDVPKLVKTTVQLGKQGAVYLPLDKTDRDQVFFLALTPGA